MTLSRKNFEDQTTSHHCRSGSLRFDVTAFQCTHILGLCTHSGCKSKKAVGSNLQTLVQFRANFYFLKFSRNYSWTTIQPHALPCVIGTDTRLKMFTDYSLSFHQVQLLSVGRKAVYLHSILDSLKCDCTNETESQSQIRCQKRRKQDLCPDFPDFEQINWFYYETLRWVKRATTKY